MATFTWTPTSAGLSKAQEPRVLKNSFGDGYSQRAQDGLNNMLAEWAIEFIDTPTVITAIDNFLTARGGWDDFEWTPPRGAAGNYICPSWTREITGEGSDSIIATFEEVADL